MEPRLIDLNDYELFGGGANGDSYNNRADKSVMLKLYTAGKTQQPLSELRLSQIAWEAGIPTPEPGELVKTEDGRLGILFRRIEGKKSYARAIGDNPEMAGHYARRFAEMSLNLHSTKVDKSKIGSVKDKYYRLLDANPFFTANEKEKLRRFIQEAPETDTALHGDLQFGNLIFVGDTNYFIDMGDLCYGYPLFDIGMVYVSCILSETEFRREAFHMDDETALRFWEAFVPAYFGEGRSRESVEAEVRPYAGLITLIVERDTRRPMAEIRAALDTIL